MVSKDFSYFQISRNCKYSKLCFPHFLINITSSVRQKHSKSWFPQDLSYFLISRIANILSYVLHTFCLTYPALSDKYFLSIGFHKTCDVFRFQGITNIPSYVFHTFLFDIPCSVRWKFSKYWFPQDLWCFQISRNFEYIKFSILFVWYNELCQTNILYALVSTRLVMFSDFKELQIYQVFHTFCLIYPVLSDEHFGSIGFHKTCDVFRFQGIANIPSYVFHTVCWIYPVLSDENFGSIGFHKTCDVFRF